MEIQAKVISRFEKVSGTNAKGEWVKQDYLVVYDYDKQYPHKMVITMFNDRVKEAQELLHKDTIANFSFDIDARESKDGRWFNSYTCFHISLPQQAQQVAPAPVQQTIPVAQPTTPAVDLGNYEQSDDLPF